MINYGLAEGDRKLMVDLRKAIEPTPPLTWVEYCHMVFGWFVRYIRDEAYSDAQKRGFHQNETGDATLEQIDEFTRKMSCEVHELWKAARDSVDGPVPSKVPSISVVEEEAADVFLGILETSKTLGIDIVYAALKKMEYNKTRGYLNGKGKQDVFGT